jgi:hypothetical protein
MVFPYHEEHRAAKSPQVALVEPVAYVNKRGMISSFPTPEERILQKRRAKPKFV